MATSAVGIPPAAAADPALQKNTVYLGAQNVPFDTSDSPGAKAFQVALKQYAPGFKPDQNTMYGWASGKLFEAAMAKVADRVTAGDVTTQMVLDGLWQLKNEKLDGLALGLSFTKGSTAKVPPCYWILLLDARGVTSPFGSRLNCFMS
jgi:branched-chain amino acid transport system substrate-binding protein